MTRMNYNRPNAGYEQEPWRKEYSKTKQPKILPLIVLEHQSRGHKVVITKCKPGSVHSGAYRCVECNLHLAWAKK